MQLGQSKDPTQLDQEFSQLTINHVNTNFCPTSLLHEVSGLPQTDTTNTKWFLDYHELYEGTHALQGLQHNSNYGVTRYILYKDHYKIP